MAGLQLANCCRVSAVLTAQPNAWQDEVNLNDWIDGSLVLHLQEHAGGSPVYLFLDSFRAHYTSSFRARMKELGIQQKLIPGGCTWLVQPLDVGVAKPFKDRTRDLWWNWMIEMAENDEKMNEPSRELIQDWVSSSWDDMPKELITNALTKTDLSWFN